MVFDQNMKYPHMEASDGLYPFSDHPIDWPNWASFPMFFELPRVKSTLYPLKCAHALNPVFGSELRPSSLSSLYVTHTTNPVLGSTLTENHVVLPS